MFLNNRDKVIMENELVTIIVPVYNSAQYLRRCIDSILAQNYYWLDIILVDDGSEDNSQKIITKYKTKDERMRSFKISHQGVGMARNIGIANAKGKYIVFIDSDDYVSKDYINNLMIDDSDFIQQGIFWEVNDRWEKLPTRYIESGIYDVKIEMIRDKMNIFNPYILWATYSKRYKTQIIRNENLQFPVHQTTAEDAVFVFQYLLRCTSATFVKKYDYFYCANIESISHIPNMNFLEDEIIALNSIKDFFRIENCPNYYRQWMLQRKKYIYNYYKNNQSKFTDEENQIIKIKLKNCKYFDC